MSLSIDELKDRVSKILREYSKCLKGKIDVEKARKSIGFQISSMKQYEIDDGVYPERSITVIPNSSKILDLFLVYNSEIGRIELELNVRAVGEYCRASRCQINHYDEDNIDPGADIKISIENSLLPKLQATKQEKSSSSVRSSVPRSIKKKETKSMICFTRDKNCCYLNKNHDKKQCSDCCYDEAHSAL